MRLAHLLEPREGVSIHWRAKDIPAAVGRAARKITVNLVAVKPDRLPLDIGGNQERQPVLFPPPAMAFALPLLMVRIKEVCAMKKSIIPWHVFNDAIETPASDTLNRWLERWQFMDGGVVLADAHVPALEMTRTNSNSRQETT